MDKPKRQLTEEQLEKLAKARAKANEVRKKNLEIKKFEKENVKYEKEQQKLEEKKNVKRRIMLFLKSRTNEKKQNLPNQL